MARRAKESSFQRRYWTLIAVLGVTAVVSVAYLYPSRSAPQLSYAQRLPKAIGPWSGEDLPVDDFTKAVLETDDVLMRQYDRPQGVPIILAVVFARENRKVAHPPEVCLTGSGFEVEQKGKVQLRREFPVIRLVTARGLYREMYYYWYKSGDLFTESYLRQQMNIAANHLLRREASASLIRVSTVVKGDDFAGAEARLREFSLALLPHVEQVLP